MATPLTDALRAQGKLEPGMAGFWQVWGGRVNDVRSGDLICWKSGDEYREAAVSAVLPDEDGVSGAIFRGFATDAGDVHLGRLCPLVLLREGTHNMLAGDREAL